MFFSMVSNLFQPYYIHNIIVAFTSAVSGKYEFAVRLNLYGLYTIQRELERSPYDLGKFSMILLDPGEEDP